MNKKLNKVALTPRQQALVKFYRKAFSNLALVTLPATVMVIMWLGEVGVTNFNVDLPPIISQLLFNLLPAYASNITGFNFAYPLLGCGQPLLFCIVVLLLIKAGDQHMRQPGSFICSQALLDASTCSNKVVMFAALTPRHFDCSSLVY